MKHLVAPIRGTSLLDALRGLSDAHRFLVARAQLAIAQIPAADAGWGVHLKRLDVNLAGNERPELISKTQERFAEVVNMLATIERLLSALRWFAAESGCAGLRVAVCHPSTSSRRDENDVVLVDETGTVRVRCEVCDVVSASAGQNGKELSDLASLGCSTAVPLDSARRFICTSSEFARAVTSKRRKWLNVRHRYTPHQTSDSTGTVLLEITAVV
jgi:hypothetical protein